LLAVNFCWLERTALFCIWPFQTNADSVSVEADGWSAEIVTERVRVPVYWRAHTAHAYASVTLSRERETRQPLVDNEILTRCRPPHLQGGKRMPLG